MIGAFTPNQHKKDKSKAEPDITRLSLPKRIHSAWSESDESAMPSFYAETSQSVAITNPTPVVTRDVVADLMNDAKRRQESTPLEVIPDAPKLLSANSETALFRKFVKEVDDYFAQNDITDKIEYDVFVTLLLNLNFIRTIPTP